MRPPALILALALLFPSPAYPFDHGFPKDTARSEFFQQLKRPDYYPHSCCGEADAYEADVYNRNPDGSYDVEITEGSAKEYPDGATRPELKVGKQIHVPANRINPPVETQFNPTAHAWVFVSIVRPLGTADAEPGLAYCFAPLPEGS
jgi:hypothetical protein